jgi:uncharacterized membrane protein (DUF2068 family)
MDAIKGIRLLAASLLTLVGIIYLTLAVFTMEIEIPTAILALVGLLYVAMGIGLFIGKRLFNYFGVVVPLIWASLGIYHYVAIKPESTLLPFIAMDIIAILCCCYLILHKTSS